MPPQVQVETCKLALLVQSAVMMMGKVGTGTARVAVRCRAQPDMDAIAARGGSSVPYSLVDSCTQALHWHTAAIVLWRPGNFNRWALSGTPPPAEHSLQTHGHLPDPYLNNHRQPATHKHTRVDHRAT